VQVGFSRALADILTDAQQIAGNMKDDYTSTEHLLLAMAAERPQDQAIAGAPRHRLQRHDAGAGRRARRSASPATTRKAQYEALANMAAT
jgi:ATP-dependent Clp protease ATP-binding subunit ClpB